MLQKQGGGKACASLHVARTVCRRAERSITTLVRDGALDKEAQTYLNRLSDFLLTVSRIAAKCDQRTENIYIPRAEVMEEKWKDWFTNFCRALIFLHTDINI